MTHLCLFTQRLPPQRPRCTSLTLRLAITACRKILVRTRDPKFTSAFWTSLFEDLGTKQQMSTAACLESDGQIWHVNRVLEDVLRIYATSFTSLSAFLPLDEFAHNNSVHAITRLTPFLVNLARHPQVPTFLPWATSQHLVAPAWRGEGDIQQTCSSNYLSLSHPIHGEVCCLTPRGVASPLCRWTSQRRIDPSLGTNRLLPTTRRLSWRHQLMTWLCQSLSSNVKLSPKLYVMAFFVFIRFQFGVDQQKANEDKKGRKT